MSEVKKTDLTKASRTSYVAMSEKNPSPRKRIIKPILRSKNSIDRSQTSTAWSPKAVVDRSAEETDDLKNPYQQDAHLPKILHNDKQGKLWTRGRLGITSPSQGVPRSPETNSHDPPQDKKTFCKPGLAQHENISDLVLSPPSIPVILKTTSRELEVELRDATGTSLQPQYLCLAALPPSSINDLLDMKESITNPSALEDAEQFLLRSGIGSSPGNHLALKPSPSSGAEADDLHLRASSVSSSTFPCCTERPRPSVPTTSPLHLRGGGIGLLGHLFGLRIPKRDPEEAKKTMDEKIGFLDWYIIGSPGRGMTWGQFSELNRKRVEKTNEIERLKKEAREEKRRAKEEKRKQKQKG